LKLPKLIKKAATSDKSGVDDGLTALSLVALNDTHTTKQRRNLRRATKKSNVAHTKNKALPPSPEDGKRICPPEELIEEDQRKQKVTTLWSRRNAKKS
jgi:hypothetical protein